MSEKKNPWFQDKVYIYDCAEMQRQEPSRFVIEDQHEEWESLTTPEEKNELSEGEESKPASE